MNTHAIRTGIHSSINSMLKNGHALFYLSIVFFSASSILIKFAGNEYGTSFWLVTTVRFTVGAAIVFTLFRNKQATQLKPLIANPWLAARGLLGGCGVLLFNLCIMKIGAGRASVITSTYPIFATLIAPIFLLESIKGRHVAYSSLAFCGVLAMSLSGTETGAIGFYDFVALFVAILSALVVVMIRKLHQSYNTATIFNAQCLYGLAFSLPGVFVTGFHLAPMEVVIVLASAICVALGQLTMTHGYKSISVGSGASIQLLSPAIVLIASILFLGESAGPLDLAGMAIIFFACWKIVGKR